MTMTEQETCEARIGAQQAGREADFAALFAIANGGGLIECEHCGGTGEHMTGAECDGCDGTGEVPATYEGDELNEEAAIERLSEYPLGLSVRRVMRVELSTGGPGDWLEVDLDEDGDVEAVQYHFNDWFDHAERTVAEGSALWRAAEYYAGAVV